MHFSMFSIPALAVMALFLSPSSSNAGILSSIFDRFDNTCGAHYYHMDPVPALDILSGQIYQGQDRLTGKICNVEVEFDLNPKCGQNTPIHVYTVRVSVPGETVMMSKIRVDKVIRSQTFMNGDLTYADKSRVSIQNPSSWVERTEGHSDIRLTLKTDGSLKEAFASLVSRGPWNLEGKFKIQCVIR